MAKKSLNISIIVTAVIVVFLLIMLFTKGFQKKEKGIKVVSEEIAKTGTREFKAKVTKIVGKVEVTRDEKTEPARIGMILGKNALIRTYDGTIDLKIVELGIFKLKPYSLLQLESLSKRTKFRLNPGKMLLVLKKIMRDSAFEIWTPTAVIGVRGTSFLVSVTKKKMKVGVLTGKVVVQSGKKTVAVAELKEVSVTEKEVAKVEKMEATTIVDVREVLKIKEIETMPEFDKIKLNIKKLEIIEGDKKSIELKRMKDRIRAKEAQEKAEAESEMIEEKDAGIKTEKALESDDEEFVEDDEF